MRRFLGRIVVGVAAIATVLALNTIPATAAVGQRIASGDGDTAGKCLDWRGGGTEPWVQMWACNAGTHQNWKYVQVAGSTAPLWEIRSLKPGYTNYCLSAPNGLGVQVSMAPCNGSYAQFWIKRVHNASWHSWENFWWAERCLDVKDYGTSNVVWLYDCLTTQGNQMWKMY